jgi:MraZ protein
MPVKLPFLNSYPGTVDDKSRLSIPSDYRHALAPECEGYLVFTFGNADYINAFPLEFYNSFCQKADPDSVEFANKENLRRDMRLFTEAMYRQMDAQGRVTLPQSVLKKAGITRDVVYAGRRTHFTIWDAKTFEAFQNQNDLSTDDAWELIIKQNRANNTR